MPNLRSFRFAQGAPAPALGAPAQGVPAPDPMAAAMGGDPMAAAMGGDPMAAAMGGDPMAGGGDPMAAAMGGDPAAGGGPMAGGGGDPLAAMMGGGGGGAMGGGAPGTAPMAAPGGGPQGTSAPLGSVSQILLDMDAVGFVDQNIDVESPEELGMRAWVMYGGNEDGTENPSKVGKRSPSHTSQQPEALEKEKAETEDRRWERLPLGKTIADITTPSALSKLLGGVTAGHVHMLSKQEMTGGQAAASIQRAKTRLALASVLDASNYHREADSLFQQVLDTLRTPKAR